MTDPRNLVFRFARWPSINNLNEIAFTDDLRIGLFNGPDPLFNKIIGAGDKLSSYPLATVGFISFQHPGLNDPGQLVFVAHMSDLSEPGGGFLAIVRADPPNNDPPVVNNPGPLSTPEGSPVTVTITATDPDGDYPLSFFETTPTILPIGTIAGRPPGIGPIEIQSGQFTGTPTIGIAGNTYAIAVEVQDARGVSSLPETFTWTITTPAPAARSGLTATEDVADSSIRLAWLNPSPDSASNIEIEFSEGACGDFGFTQLVSLAPGSTAYTWVHGTPGHS